MLRKIYSDYFDIGCAVNRESLKKHREFIKNHYNSLTLENDMKLENILVSEEQYNFDFPDEVVNYAVDHNMKVRGHTLVWHNQYPQWLFKENGHLVTRATLLKRMKTYMNDIMNHFGDKIYAWDVVNEAIEDKTGAYLRESQWLEVLGEDYIHEAFSIAHQVNPNAQLFYNDYNETDPEKREKIYKLVKGLKDRGTPIHGIGMQGHWNIYTPDLSEIRATIERFASLDVRLQITELDLSIFKFEDHRKDLLTLDRQFELLQAERYEQIFSLLREYRKEIDAVTFWGVADDYTWLDDFPIQGRKNWPFVFDENAQPKLSYQSITNF